MSGLEQLRQRISHTWGAGRQIADRLGISTSALSNKLNSRAPMSINEMAVAIRYIEAIEKRKRRK